MVNNKNKIRLEGVIFDNSTRIGVINPTSTYDVCNDYIDCKETCIGCRYFNQNGTFDLCYNNGVIDNFMKYQKSKNEDYLQ